MSTYQLKPFSLALSSETEDGHGDSRRLDWAGALDHIDHDVNLEVIEMDKSLDSYDDKVTGEVDSILNLTHVDEHSKLDDDIQFIVKVVREKLYEDIELKGDKEDVGEDVSTDFDMGEPEDDLIEDQILEDLAKTRLDSPETYKAIRDQVDLDNDSDDGEEDSIQSVTESEVVPSAPAILFVKTSANNTHMSFRWTDGTTFKQVSKSSGAVGYKGTKRGTPYAAEHLTTSLVKEVEGLFSSVHILFEGVGRGRASVASIVEDHGIEVLSVSDVTSLPHNGCRPKKQRRI